MNLGPGAGGQGAGGRSDAACRRTFRSRSPTRPPVPGRQPEAILSSAVSRLILASASARRAELLTAAGFTFDIIPADVDETPLAEEQPTTYASRVAGAKAERVMARLEQSSDVVLAADTVVVAGGLMMGKPRDNTEAVSMLKRLSGKIHKVHTAVVVRFQARKLSELVTTRVRFVEMTDVEIAEYVASEEPRGKAGAYAIQGRAARFIDWIDGSWSNVVGLPIATVHRLLKTVGTASD
jgi:septum formation protein